MGFGFRKSFGSGLFRFTLSPSGLSSSFGVRGARISSGPRGTFVTVSSHGAYYRHRIDGSAQQRLPPVQQPKVQDSAKSDPVFQVPIAELVGSNQSELVMKLNENVAATNPAFLSVGISCLTLLLIPSYPTTASIVFALSVLISIFTWRWFTRAHTHEIHYALDDRPISSSSVNRVPSQLSQTVVECGRFLLAPLHQPSNAPLEQEHSLAENQSDWGRYRRRDSNLPCPSPPLRQIKPFSIFCLIRSFCFRLIDTLRLAMTNFQSI